jgi:hypothetical protein
MYENDYSAIYGKTIKTIVNNVEYIVIIFTDGTKATICSYDGLWISKEK